MVRARGQLEHELMEALWDAPDGLTARQLVDVLDGPPAAITTLLTVLDRLRTKRLILRTGERGSGYVFRAAASREEDLVNTMVASLTSTADRPAALLRFAGELDADDAAVLRQALDRIPKS